MCAVLCYCSAVHASLPLLGPKLVCNGFRPQCTPSLGRREAMATRTRKCSTSSSDLFLFKMHLSSWLDTWLVFVVFFLSFLHGMIVQSLGFLGVSFAGLPLFLFPLLRRLSLLFAWASGSSLVGLSALSGVRRSLFLAWGLEWPLAVILSLAPCSTWRGCTVAPSHSFSAYTPGIRLAGGLWGW